MHRRVLHARTIKKNRVYTLFRRCIVCNVCIIYTWDPKRANESFCASEVFRERRMLVTSNLRQI